VWLQQGSEAVLSIAYGSAMQKLVNDSLRYIAFDFHRICGHIHFERLSSLYNDIREDLDKQGYYLVNADGKILEKQKGVVRTNCIDCLDRTNVTQVICCLITTLFYDVHSHRERTLKLGI
jgi:hypothetical protein